MPPNRFIRIVWPLLGFGFLALGAWMMVDNGVWETDPKPLNTGLVFFGLLITLLGLGMICLERAWTLSQMVGQLLAVWKGGGGSGKPLTEDQIKNRISKNKTVIGAQEKPPPPEVWYTNLRPVLHQAAQYSVPTYYLDCNYHVVDWNVAFELVFSRIAAELRGKHVNWFIAQLDNAEQVFRHAQEFSDREIPLIDLEPLVYTAAEYGETRFLKVASQLHDEAGNYRGWSVALIVQQTNWARLQKDLKERLTEDKIWSVYAASYDAVLLNYENYGQLIDKVISVIPEKNQVVVDLGAGTGNVTERLLKQGHTVTVVENTYAMLDRLRAKNLDAGRVRVVKSSVEHLGTLEDASFDAAVMVNVLYAVEDPLTCLQGINRILKMNGAFGLSTTFRGGQLDTLLADIERKLKEDGKYEELADDFARLEDINLKLKRIAFRHSQEDYLQWLKMAGFEVTAPPTIEYQGAVMVVHAKKTGSLTAGSPNP